MKGALSGAGCREEAVRSTCFVRLVIVLCCLGVHMVCVD